MTNFFRIINADGKRIIIITDKTFEQVQNYYIAQQIDVQIAICYPSREEVLYAVPLCADDE